MYCGVHFVLIFRNCITEKENHNSVITNFRIDEREVLAEVTAETLDDAGQERAADAIAAAVTAF